VRSVLVLSLLLLAGPASAQDTWTTPFPGVRHLHRVLPDQDIHAMLVDLCADGVSVRATASGERGQRTSSFGASVGAQVAINGDYFDLNGTYRTDGYTAHDGQVWPDTQDHGEVAQWVFGPEQVHPYAHWEVTSPQYWWKEVISGHWTLLQDGAYHDNSGDVGTHPRTALGLTKDRRTLILAVVDGRAAWAGRRGMSFPELTALMADLGAHWAVGLDGGGSSTMWMQGAGILNHPSDGSERTVANHLAIYATGQGAPAHCDRAFEEVLMGFPNLQEGDSSDVDGDGRADACGRDRDGITCATSAGGSFRAPFRGPALRDADEWWWPSRGLTLRMADLDGDGRADACAYDPSLGVRCWRSSGSGFEAAEWRIPEMAWDAWHPYERSFTLMLGDYTGDGKADACARGGGGLHCWPSTGSGFGPRVDTPEFTDADGFTLPGRFGSLRMADVNGDGRLDVCGRNELRLVCRLSDGTAFPTRVEGPLMPAAYGYDLPRFGLTLRLADVDGDGKADACFRTSMDFRCHLSTGTGFQESPVLGPPLADGIGFWHHRYFSTLRLLDLDGDGDRDVCVRGGNRVSCWKWEGAGFSAVETPGPGLADAWGWGGVGYYPTLRAADVNGDGKEDLCARGATNVHCWLSDGNGFPTEVAGPAWADTEWHWLLHSPSLRMATPPKRPLPPPETCGNALDDDRDGEVDEGCPAEPPDAGTPAGPDAGTALDGGTGPGTVPGPRVAGCGCSGGGGLPVAWLLAVAAWPLRNRRARPRRS
jgi:hypothetical protein